MEYLAAKTIRIIIGNGKDGILQTNLWKKLDLTGRNGSRIATRLEKRSLIIREKIRHDGRWTYRLFAAKLPADTQYIEQAPCLTCPVEHMCSVESAYSPNNCNLIEEWALLSFPSNSPQLSLNRYEQLQNGTREKELVVREVKPATRRRAQRIAKNSKKRSFN
ncbi:MAG: transcriptional regulator [Nitrososphaeraceae archaeon]